MVTNSIKVNAPWGSRRAGLSRNQKVDPLHKTINGKSRSQASQESTDKRLPEDFSIQSSDNERPSMNLPGRLSSPLESSDVEISRRDPGKILSSPGLLGSPVLGSQKSAPKSSQASIQRAKKIRELEPIDTDPDSENDGLPTRGDIARTEFKTSNKEESATDSISGDSTKGTGTLRQHARKYKSGSGLSASPKKKPDIEKDMFGDTIRRAPARTYGAKKKFGRRNSEERGSKRENTSTSNRETKRQKSSQDDVKNEIDFSGDEKPRVLPELLKLEPDSSPLRPASSIPLRLDSSPRKPPAGLPKKISKLDEAPGSATQIEPFRIPDLLDDPFRADVDWTTTPTAATSKAKKQKNDDEGISRSQSPIRLISSPVIPLSEPPSSPIHLPALLKPAVCPLCKEEVDRDLLTEFQDANPLPTVQLMQKFCLKHRKRSAREVWVEKGYPDIKWRKLDHRIAKLYPFISSILQGKTPSFYAAQFRNKIKGGQNKTLLLSDENLTPGYYGIRGLRQMSENLIEEFSSVLRKRALEDGLISARGHTAYLQGVLVPELATRLVMEDMEVGEEEARGILGESSWVGELVNDEIADVVFESDSEEEGEDER
ncbi:RTC4-like domain-containing protein [Apiosordaria backusii]|uniref:Restriction of telomere capping protein 4 n=1 Tax=Apiosordaria backusii TaxID=314023 RepID=A0AA40EYI0_9PEZI|nr:RTC4-like domain-containing protein [Apiosordaria backusii]